MDADDHIAIEFDRLLALGEEGRALQPLAQRIVFYVVAARCEKDINGFDSIYEQELDQESIALLIQGLNMIGERELANKFQKGHGLLDADGFYEHMNWNDVSDLVKSEIEVIGDRIGDQLWDLDEKLNKLLDDA